MSKQRAFVLLRQNAERTGNKGQKGGQKGAPHMWPRRLPSNVHKGLAIFQVES